MSIELALFQLFLILVIARLLAEFAFRMGLPSVLGELVAGLLLGASGLGWVEVNDVISLFAEIGIVLLLFEIGLHSNVIELIHVGKQSVLVALGGLIFPLVLGAVAAYWFFDLPLLTSLFVAASLTATSIAITVRVLSQQKIQHTIVARIVLGAAVLDDVVGVILLGLLYEFARAGEVDAMKSLALMFYVMVFVLLTPLAVNFISAIVERLEKNDSLPGLVPVSMVSMVVLFACLAELMGLPRIIGGFAAGVALSKNFNRLVKMPAHIHRAFARKINRELTPIAQLFTPVFFVTVGLSLDLHDIDWEQDFVIGFGVVMLFLAVLGKILGGLLLKLDWPQRLLIGLAMVPRGEVSLVYAQLGLAAGVFNHEIYAALLAVIAALVLLSPYWMSLFYSRYSKTLSEFYGPEKN
jgi:Kef-type K+ transport system membrane component KefB